MNMKRELLNQQIIIQINIKDNLNSILNVNETKFYIFKNQCDYYFHWLPYLVFHIFLNTQSFLNGIKEIRKEEFQEQSYVICLQQQVVLQY
ncbi:unnamed protein product [Paramecium pentaurelia]|uniref:Uncharacterized protein n=1 Tax=Paramecium pentaurelia TaxID=43138 RepID=A0A8S1Y9T5_9CILI|nr:unnamed protein product [Paramecium pentaurelia]